MAFKVGTQIPRNEASYPKFVRSIDDYGYVVMAVTDYGDDKFRGIVISRGSTEKRGQVGEYIEHRKKEYEDIKGKIILENKFE